MRSNKVNELKDLLTRLNAGESPEAVKDEAQAFLATIDPSELSAAEQALVDAGLPPESLRHLCSAHMEMMSGQLEQVRARIPHGHVLDTLYEEHEMILGFLDKLEQTNQAIQKMDAYDAARPEFGLLLHLADHLVGAERHHEREENVLFPAVRNAGLWGPPDVMVMEHNELRPRKKQLKELARQAGAMDFAEFKKELDRVARFIVFTLRDHIFKENNILYPTALEMVRDPGAWEQMKVDCDRIGYCCFTPK